tara:strand:- start:239 stop:496 length:258 start_codon:yes stop_codon:yes gene_type:complete
MVEWREGEVTTWSKVTYENGLVIPLDQLEHIIKKAVPESFRNQAMVPTDKEVSIKCFYESGLEHPESADDQFAGISVNVISNRTS